MYKDIRVDSAQLEAALAARLKIRAGFDKPTAGMGCGHDAGQYDFGA